MLSYLEQNKFSADRAGSNELQNLVGEQSPHDRLSIGLKNDSEQLSSFQFYSDWGLTDDFHDQGWCMDLSLFIATGQPVFAVEFTDTGIDFNLFCQRASFLELTVIHRKRDLDAYIRVCA